MAVKKRPTGDELSGLLLEGHFGQNPSDLPMTDPVTIVQMVLKLDDIKAYDRNPRREINPAYDSIKESILNQRGLNNPFTITRRPGDDHFMVESGGNTRLKILRELYQETQDEVFNQIQCLFVPWKSEANVLTAHLIENEMRGDMTLIDKAYAVRELKRQLEEDQDTSLSRSAFVRRTNDMGYSLSRRVLQRFEYALELDQYIPNTLRKGLGAHKIDGIKTTENAYRKFCHSKTDQFASLFAHIMSEHDADNWDFEAVRRDLDQQLSVIIKSAPHQLRLEVDAILFNQSFAETDLKNINGDQNDPISDSELPIVKSDANDVDLLDNSDTKNTSNPTTKTSQAPSKSKSQPQIPPEQSSADASSQTHELALDSFISPKLNEAPQQSAEPDLKSLHSRSNVLATRIAQSIQMQHLIIPIQRGLGFIIEKPDGAFKTQISWGLWWLLMGIAEQSVTEERVLCWQDTELFQLYADHDDTALNELIGDPPSLQLFPYEVLQNQTLLSDQVFNDIFRLIETCRLIRRHFPAEQLWPAPNQP